MNLGEDTVNSDVCPECGNVIYSVYYSAFRDDIIYSCTECYCELTIDVNNAGSFIQKGRKMKLGIHELSEEYRKTGDD